MRDKKNSRLLKKWGITLLLLIITIAVQYYPSVVEQYYTRGIYPFIGYALRFLFGWLPFSVGDALAAVLIIVLSVILIKGIYLLIKATATKKGTLQKTGSIVYFLCWLYIAFHWLWGFNYYREGSSSLLHISMAKYSTDEVTQLSSTMAKRLQEMVKDSIVIEKMQTQDRQQLAANAAASFNRYKDSLVIKGYGPLSFKPHLIGKLQSYTGYAGYYFPFTGESHANLYAPVHTLAFTVAHEMAHQQGFASESEANMIAYYVSRKNANPAIAYSTYYAMYHYALGELYKRDSTQAKALDKTMPAMVRADRKRQRDFYEAHQNPAQPVLDAIYTKYLLSNNQPEGLESYNRVVAWLIAYAKKYGWNSL